MTDVTILALPREDVIAGLGCDYFPVPADATLLRIDPAAGVTDGAVIIYATPGMPGVMWWLIDGAIPPQAAGLVTEELAAQVPGSVLEAPPPITDPEQPWPTYP
ncbi:hypothetical protein OG195_27260 [Streptomyces sp. NBC_01362]|uniref:hypothetical protein n=1 Tax=unclassified Streptomyces TaxID=2593676 RepID=UPI00295876EB|nr:MULTISPECIES: hypothetical protein [unclassified Streptomyces]MDV9194315.1 hypothetical protein [Streptomyces sp. Wh19]